MKTILLSLLLIGNSLPCFAGGSPQNAHDIAAPDADVAAQAYIDQVLNPMLASKGWHAKKYQSKVLNGHSLVWLTMGGECSDQGGFVLDFTDPKHPNFVQVNEALMEHGLAPYSGLSDMETASVEYLGYALGVVFGIPVINSKQDIETARKARNLTSETIATRWDLSNSLAYFSQGDVAKAKQALPNPSFCKYSPSILAASKYRPKGELVQLQTVPVHSASGEHTVGAQ